jgi:hypothetical protein
LLANELFTAVSVLRTRILSLAHELARSHFTRHVKFSTHAHIFLEYLLPPVRNEPT